LIEPHLFIITANIMVLCQ